MIHFIQNDYLKVGVKEFGCEITSIVSKESGFEFLWQGDPSVWGGQSPILFPFIGRLLNDTYTLNGKDYTMQKHGFARKLPWQLFNKDEDSVSFILTENEETLKAYPYCFELVVTFMLNDRKLIVKHEVKNKNNADMYFSLGAHPAFNCEIGDTLVFDDEETLNCMSIDLENSLLLPETYPLLQNEKTIIITEDIFKNDALIFEGVKSANITLIRKSDLRKVIFNLGNSPYLGIWAKPGAPYVCIEPWYGLNDSHEKKSDLSEKVGIQKLTSDEFFTFTWDAEFIG